MLARWRAGDVKLSDEMEARGRVLACRDVTDLSLASLRRLYGLPE